MLNEYKTAEQFLVNLITDFHHKNNQEPVMIFISDDEELQSIMMWVCENEGWKYKRTKNKKTYCSLEENEAPIS